MQDSESEDTLSALLGEAPFLKRLALGLCRSVADAEDLVQETWVEALRRPPGIWVRRGVSWLR